MCPDCWQVRPNFFFYIHKFIYLIYLFLLHRVFIAGCGLSLVRRAGAALRCSAWASHCGGFSCCGAWALGMQASVVVACRLSSCGARA